MIRGMVWLCFLFFSIFSVHAEDTQTDAGGSGSICNENLFEIVGPQKIIKGFASEYSLAGKDSSLKPEQIQFELFREGKAIEKKQGEKYVRIFNQAGEITLKSEVVYGDCKHTYEKNIRVYDSQYLLLGEKTIEVEQNFSDFFEKNNILFLTLPHHEKEYDISTVQGTTSLVQEYQQNIKQAQKIFIHEDVSINVLDAFVKTLKTSKNIDFSSKDIFIITSKNNSFLSKLLAPYIQQLGIKKIGFIREDSFLNSLTNIIGNLPTGIVYISFDKQQNFLSLNVFIRYLTYSGLELSFIALFLTISFTIVFVNFSKQFLGFNVFGVYYPIFLALCLVLLKISFVLVFFILGFISLYLVTLISNKTYLLSVPKRSLLISIFSLLTLIFLGIDNYFSLGIIDISAFSNSFILFPFLLLLLISDKILHEEVHIMSKKGLFYIGELLLITGMCYVVMNSITIQYFLLTYPDVLFLFFVFNILISKYTGLQLLEYVRFSPLLKKISEEE